MPELEINMPLPDETPEQKPEVKPEPKLEKKSEDAPQYSELETKMMEQGWVPRDQFEGEDEEFVGAAEYQRRGQLFKKIADTNRRLDRSNQALQALQAHQKKMYDAGYSQALRELKEQHAAAVDDGDKEAAVAILEKIESTKEQQAQSRQAPVIPNEPPAVLTEFIESNSSWYQKDDVMTAYADTLGHKFAQAEIKEGRQPSLDDVLAHVEKKVREKFPSVFERKQRGSQPPPVGPAASPARVPSKGKAFTAADLNENERHAMKGFVRDGTMTEQEYLDDIKKLRGIK